MKFLKKIIILAASIIFIYIIFSFFFPEKLYKLSIQMQRKSAGLVQKELQVDDHKIVYLEGGTGAETLVLIHGFGIDKDTWLPMAKLLPEYHLVIPDLPGFGESTKSDSAKYDIVSQVGRIDKFLGKLGLTRYYIAGGSMGGNISGIYAVRYPQKIKALILIDNSGVTAPIKSVVFKSIENGVNPLLVNNRDDYSRLLKYIFFKEPYIPYQIKNVLADMAIKNRAFNEKISMDMMAAPAMFENNFEKFTMPVLIIWGDKDQILDVSSVQVLEKGIKNHTTRILKECGHVPMSERPEETAAYIRKFIETKK